uniref:Uncharacterized protein n=1 Tax=Pogona vitticeps TaxID=103695 RepID=A0A6J0UVR6_9SAUR
MSYQRHSRSSQTSLMSPRLIKASDVRQRQEGVVDRRHPNQRTRNGQSSSNTDICPNACPISASKVNRKQRRKPSHVHRPFSTLTSSSSSVSSQTEENNLSYQEEPYIEKRAIAPLYGRKEESGPSVDDTCPVGKTHLKSWKARRPPEESDVVLERDSSTTEDAGTRARGGCSKSDPHSVPQKVSSQRIATPKKTRRFLDGVAPQSFRGTPQLTDHDPALALPSPDRNAEPLLRGEPSPSRRSPSLPPRFAVPHPEQRDVDRESTEEHLSSLALPLGSPATEKTVRMLLIFKKQHGGKDSVEAQGMKMVLDPSRVGTHNPQGRNIRRLGEEQTCVEGSLEMSSFGVVGQGFVDDNKDTVSLHSSAMISDSCCDSSGGLHFKMDANMSVLERTHSQAPCSDGQRDVYEEIDTTVTSHCTLVQKMCQIDFPLAAEEEKASK